MLFHMTDDEVNEFIIKARARGKTYKEIGMMIGMNYKTVEGIVRHRLKMSKPRIQEKVVYTDDEVWKSIDIDPRYNISNKGRISRNGKLLKTNLNTKGYLSVVFGGRTKEVHRLVAKAFINPNLTSEDIVNHKDFDRTNPCVENLEITNTLGNVLYTVNAERNLKHVPEVAVRYICQQLELGRHDTKNIMIEVNLKFNLNVSLHYIHKFRRTNSRSDIQNQYNIPKANSVSKFKDEEVEMICSEMENIQKPTTARQLFDKLGLTGRVNSPAKYLNKLLYLGRRKTITSKYDIQNWLNVNSTTSRET